MIDTEAATRTLRHVAYEALSPAELAQEIERWEHLRALWQGDLKAHDFAVEGASREQIAGGIAYADVRLAALEKQAKRVLRANGGNGAPTRLDFARARYVDVVELAETLTSQTARHVGRQHYVIRCPFHDGDDTPSLRIYPPGGGWACFGCGRAGQDAASFAAEFFHCSQAEGLRWVEMLCHIP